MDEDGSQRQHVIREMGEVLSLCLEVGALDGVDPFQVWLTVLRREAARAPAWPVR